MSDVEEDRLSCAEKHCSEEALLGMTLVYDGMRIEVFFCEEHFDQFDAIVLPVKEGLIIGADSVSREIVTLRFKDGSTERLRKKT